VLECPRTPSQWTDSSQQGCVPHFRLPDPCLGKSRIAVDCGRRTEKARPRVLPVASLNRTYASVLLQGTLEVGDNPAFLVEHPQLSNVLYGTTECIDKNGEVLAFHIDPQNPDSLRLVARQDAGGRSTCFLNIDCDGRSVTAVNYWDARVCVLPLQGDGTPGAVCDADVQPGAEYVDEAAPGRAEHWQYRQRWPHTHCAVQNPQESTGRLYVCDLGRDAVVQYELSHTEGGAALRKTGEVTLNRHLGPRHIVFHPTLPAAYIVNELTSSVSVLKVCPFSGRTGPNCQRCKESVLKRTGVL